MKRKKHDRGYLMAERTKSLDPVVRSGGNVEMRPPDSGASGRYHQKDLAAKHQQRPNE